MPASGAVCFLRGASDGVILLRPRGHLQEAPDDPAVLARRARGQVFWFRESVQSASPPGGHLRGSGPTRGDAAGGGTFRSSPGSGLPAGEDAQGDVSSGGTCFHAWQAVPNVGTELDLGIRRIPARGR